MDSPRDSKRSRRSREGQNRTAIDSDLSREARRHRRPETGGEAQVGPERRGRRKRPPDEQKQNYFRSFQEDNSPNKGSMHWTDLVIENGSAHSGDLFVDQPTNRSTCKTYLGDVYVGINGTYEAGDRYMSAGTALKMRELELKYGSHKAQPTAREQKDSSQSPVSQQDDVESAEQRNRTPDGSGFPMQADDDHMKDESEHPKYHLVGHRYLGKVVKLDRRIKHFAEDDDGPDEPSPHRIAHATEDGDGGDDEPDELSLD